MGLGCSTGTGDQENLVCVIRSGHQVHLRRFSWGVETIPYHVVPSVEKRETVAGEEVKS